MESVKVVLATRTVIRSELKKLIGFPNINA